MMNEEKTDRGDAYEQSGNLGIGDLSGGEVKDEAKVAGVIHEAPSPKLETNSLNGCATVAHTVNHHYYSDRNSEKRLGNPAGGTFVVFVIVLLIVWFWLPDSSNPRTKTNLESHARNNNSFISNGVSQEAILVDPNHLPYKTEELIKILEYRASRIKADLEKHFEYAPVQEYLISFDKLHTSHISALRQGHLIHAHEILIEIHELSYELEKNEFWERHNKHFPNTNYMLNYDAFERGYLINYYVHSKVIEVLIERRMKRRYRSIPEVEIIIAGMHGKRSLYNPKIQINIAEIYGFILASNTPVKQ